MKRQQPERQVQKAVKELFERVGGKVWVFGTVRGKEDAHKGTRQTPGPGDLFITLPHRWQGHGSHDHRSLWFECKSGHGRQSAAQREFQRWCEIAQVPYVLGGVDDAIAWLREGGWLKG